jgi:hypothetical protein
VQKLLSPGPWSHLGVAPIQAAVNFFYQLERCKLFVNLNEAQIQQPDQQPLSALLFFPVVLIMKLLPILLAKDSAIEIAP